MTCWKDEENEKRISVSEKIPRVKRKREKGEGWIPWLMEAKKDVISCDKPRGSANTT